MDMTWLMPRIGAWAWHPEQPDEFASRIDHDDLLDSFNGLPTLLAIGCATDPEKTVLCWKVDGFFSASGLWLYVGLSDMDLDALDAQEVMMPGEILVNQDLPRLVTWARTLHDRITHRGSLVVEPGTESMTDILDLLPVDPQVREGRSSAAETAHTLKVVAEAIPA